MNNCNRCRKVLDFDNKHSKNMKYKNLCVECLKAESLKVNNLKADALCALSMEVKDLWAERESVNDLCASGRVTAQEVWAKNANLDNACVTNLRATNFAQCNKFRATVNYSVDTTYTLGQDLGFDNVLDDPNGNISMGAFTSYTVPETGYYMMSYKVNINNVVSQNPVLGIPVANPTVWVNGELAREAYSPFLSFFSTQKVIVDSLMTLNQGDVVTMRYDILGEQGVPVVGTVDIVGTGIEDGNSFFKIIHLSSLCDGNDQPEACPPVEVPCPRLELECEPSDVNCYRDCHDHEDENMERGGSCGSC